MRERGGCWGEDMKRYDWLMHTMEQCRKAAAIVSKDMMVLHHTQACEPMLDSGGFYSVQDWLPNAACEAIRTCIDSEEMQVVSADLGHMRCQIQMIPLETEALLILEGMQEASPALLLSALRMREKAEHLLNAVERLRTIAGAEEEAGKIRNTAMQLLRQAQHTEALSGSGLPLSPESCDMGQLVQQAAQALRARGYNVCAWTEQELFVTADPPLLKAALLTLVVNSIQAGADHIILKTALLGERVLVRVEDNGARMPRKAVQRMRDGWRMNDSSLLDRDWGLGLPFAVRVAEMHGGQLYHIADAQSEGCVMCLSLPKQENDAAKASGIYVGSMLDPVETELSVLE